MDCDVVIAGAGPVGLLLACELRLAGVSILVFDKLADPNLPIKEGRLRGELTRPDYDFLDLRLNEFYHLLTSTVRPWIHKEGLTYQLDYAWDEFSTVTRLARGLEGAEEYRTALQSLTKESNERLFQHVEECLDSFERGDRSKLTAGPVRAYCEAGGKRLLAIRNSFIARNVQLLVDAISADCKSGPVLIPQIH